MVPGKAKQSHNGVREALISLSGDALMHLIVWLISLSGDALMQLPAETLM